MSQTSESLLPEPASALCSYMDDLVESLRKLVPAALKKFDEDAIHDARVATRRLKAALDLMEPALSNEHRKPFARAARQLRRRLGPMRDLDVMIGHLRSVQKRETHRAAAVWLEGQLDRARDRARRDSEQEQSPSRVLARLGSWWGLREEILDAGNQAYSLVANALHLQLDAFAAQAELLAKKDPAARQDPHQLRIAGKALRYTLEMAKCEGHAIPPAVAAAFKRMQDALGDWHDYVVLTERAMSESLEALLPHHDMELQKHILDFARLTLERSKKELDRFSQLWSNEGAGLIKTIRQAVPLAAKSIEQPPPHAPPAHIAPAHIPEVPDAASPPAQAHTGDPAAA
jgi:CHAD domain-containing protein